MVRLVVVLVLLQFHVAIHAPEGFQRVRLRACYTL